jgi:hypothetical protein
MGKIIYWCEKLFNFANRKLYSKVSRLEVISRKDGRVFVKNRGVEIDGFSLQDNWRTLKIFIN